uniref:Uncharacterized protein n=1 Tax=Rhizophora mucronata TaxID=61149 RepID=A0A2P2M8W3_RHIMU
MCLKGSGRVHSKDSP